MPTPDATRLSSTLVAELTRPVMERWPIEAAWLYGSIARGTQSKTSDADIIFELIDGARMGLDIWNFQQELEEALGIAVDVQLTPDRSRANPVFMRNFDRDKVMIYERTTG